MQTAEWGWEIGAGFNQAAVRARAGDRDAWGKLYQSYYRRVLGLSRRLLGSQEEAEDAADEVFLKLQRALATYNESLSFSSWLLSVARNHCLDRLRERRLERERYVDQDPNCFSSKGPGDSALARLLSREQRRRIRKEIDRLPEHLRTPLIFRYYGEMTYDEIAATLGLRRNTVATLIHRAKTALRRRMGHLQTSPAPVV